ncbi:hypothetical protein GJA_2897 [Janthinobacterium agaricidamnosum NBRC 102515 = DSM 9628]|uniref:Uncharacterized protein n=1 Tax=Janthinobacterium agaricidamnosum NBRC 102515 = DSM 9628 TaxID=1349767 RepID=W0V6M6_9BURK|nr:hypothetical protein [Janthinobacterium agaricidamnosum]CDG83526.1 hypothetical protein GJA_2897 [Janthinobacterium agaricidamnosum NBRC 102515 = DSM 9628]
MKKVIATLIAGLFASAAFAQAPAPAASAPVAMKAQTLPLKDVAEPGATKLPGAKQVKAHHAAKKPRPKLTTSRPTQHQRQHLPPSKPQNGFHKKTGSPVFFFAVILPALGAAANAAKHDDNGKCKRL